MKILQYDRIDISERIDINQKNVCFIIIDILKIWVMNFKDLGYESL